ncbi:MAG: helix-turn-helix domain-containing protein [Clostridiales bacterium]|nr:helix-turn-helix domain-containing protein [Clostridiales bacterium]
MIPFQKINEASKTTGLSLSYLRKGCKDGTVPHIKSGKVYLINVPALLEMLDKQSKEQ